jgi:hypothetical protein
MEPASIRTKNPGAMWGSALAKKWGSTETITLHDGLGQGNNIAVFPTFVQGICAQLDLWRTSKNYRNKRFADAIAIWSGHNNVPSYIAYVKARVPGMTENTIMDDAFWHSPMGIAFLKAQAGHEAGKPYPAPAGDWIQAQNIVFAGVKPQATIPPKVGVPAATGTTTAVAAQAASAGGASPWVAVLIIVVGLAITVGLAWFFHRKEISDALPVLVHPTGEGA